MVDTTIDAGNLYISNGNLKSSNTIIKTTGTQKVVKIETTKLDYNYDNPVTVLPIPVSGGNRLSNTAHSRVLDLKIIKEVISIQGFLADEETERAITKRDNLIFLGRTGNGLLIVYGRGNYQTLWLPGTLPYGGFILKAMFTETAGIVGEGKAGDAPPEKNIAIQIQLVRGKDLASGK